jgi:hypothetical protein
MKIRELKAILDNSVYSDEAELVIEGSTVKIIEPEKGSIESKNAYELQKIKRAETVNELYGIFHDVADPKKIPLEKDAWANAAVEKWKKFNEQNNCNP